MILGLTLAIQKTPTLLVLNKADDTVWIREMSATAKPVSLKTGPNPNEVAVSPDGKFAAISDMGGNGRPGGETMTIINLQSKKVEKTINLKPNHVPHGVVWLNNQKIAYTSHATDTLNELDFSSGRVTRTLKTDQKGTHLVVFTKDQKQAFTVNAVSGTVTAFDFTNGTINAQITCGDRAEGISISPDDKWLACGNVGANSVSLINPKTLKVEKTIENVGGPIRTIFTADSKHILVSSVTNGTLEVFNTQSFAKTATIELKQKPVADAQYGNQWPVPMNLWRAKNGKIYTVLVTSHAVAEIDPKTWKVTKTFETGPLPDGMAVSD
jgi:YVTN family beta-propeller protein